MQFRQVAESSRQFHIIRRVQVFEIMNNLLKQHFRFLNKAAANEVGSGAPGGFFQHFIEVIDVYCQLVGVVFGGT